MAVGKSAYKRKERNTGTRKRKPIIFMIAEGKNKTETLYFKAFSKDVDRIVRFAPGTHTDPENMVVYLREFMKENDFDPALGDKAYCLVDTDIAASKNAHIAHADELAAKCGIQVIASAPCFEYWYICHYVLSGRKYSSNKEVLSDLERYIPGYAKGMVDIYEKTKSELSKAIKNAQSMEKRLSGDGLKKHTVDFTPSTEVYKVAVELNMKD